MEYKMGSCIGISQRQVNTTEERQLQRKSIRRHSRAARECGRREVHSSVRRKGGSAS